MQMLSTTWIQKTAIALVLCLYGSAAGAYDLMDIVMTSAWKNRDMETIDQARSLGWDFGTFLERTIEKQRDACHDAAVSTADMRNCENEAQQIWDEVLNAEYQTLMDRIEDTEGLMELQKTWVKYRDLKCSWTGHTLGTAGSIAAASCFSQMTQERALELIADTTCLRVEGCLW